MTLSIKWLQTRRFPHRTSEERVIYHVNRRQDGPVRPARTDIPTTARRVGASARVRSVREVHDHLLRNTHPSLFEFSLCLSRACLGKMIILVPVAIKWHRKRYGMRFSHHLVARHCQLCGRCELRLARGGGVRLARVTALPRVAVAVPAPVNSSVKTAEISATRVS
jgi:hypothetical protein